MPPLILVDGDACPVKDDVYRLAARHGIKVIVVSGGRLHVPLAARCLPKGARVIASDGRVFTEDSIGGALAHRELADQLRQMGEMTGGPAPYSKADRSRFLARLGEAIQAIKTGA